jgi:hydroxymethylbilane synthase
MTSTTKNKRIRLGTRGSKLALIQTEMVESALRAAHPDLEIERVILKTSGDWKPQDGETALKADQGGKGQFIKEIEQALLEGRVDVGVHSMKDVPAALPEGFAVDHIMPREDPRDALLLPHKEKLKTIADLPENALIGSASMRRVFMLKKARPDLKITVLRGNVDTRIAKLNDGMVDATLLAVSGLKRMGLEGCISKALEVDEMIPAGGQGAVGLETRADDPQTQSLLDPLNHNETALCVHAERAFLKALQASCHTPIGVYARFDVPGTMHLSGALGPEDGSAFYDIDAKSSIQNRQEAEHFGLSQAQIIIDKTPQDILDRLGIFAKAS